MIELELKYKLNCSPKVDFEITSQKDVEDIYYDTDDYTLIQKGNFLRVRNNKSIDFKLSANDLTHLYCNETNFDLNSFNVDSVAKTLNNIGVDIEFRNSSELFEKLKVLAPIKKHRKSYNIEKNVVMVIDEVEDLGTFLEIEYDIDKESITKDEAEYYKNYLLNILKRNNLLTNQHEEVHVGYVELYLKKYNIDAYNLGLYK